VTKVLVIDDSALVRKLFGRVLSSEADFEVQFARDGLDGLEQLRTFKPDVVTLDLNMPQMNGLACLDRIMVEHPCPVLIVSSLSTEGADTTLEALRLGAVDFVTKPSGAVSLKMDIFAPELIAKVRAAAGVKLKTSLRLRDRVQHRMAGKAPTTRPPRGTSAPSRASGAGLVLIGTSTGGPPALEAVLTALPVHFPWPIVVAQHMPASFTAPLARRLDGLSAIAIDEVTRPVALEAGHAYIGRGDADVVICRRAGALSAMSVPPRADYPWHPSTERLVESALDHLSPEQIVGVLMTGMGNDGAEAMAELHRQGGRTIAEAEETAVVWGMPGELVKAEGADWILPLPKIATHLEMLVPLHAAHS
jgi:two-component system chemotaxis response regulator CheB